jgi:hypothetical protein
MGTLHLKKNDSVDVIRHSITKQEKERSDLMSKDQALDQVHVGTLSQYNFRVAAN